MDKKVEKIKNTISKEYSNPASKLCYKLPECVDVLALQNLDASRFTDYQRFLCLIKM